MGRRSCHASVLAVARERAGLTQHEAALRLDIGRRTLQRYERDPEHVPLGILKKMAVLFDMRWKDLVARIRATTSSGANLSSALCVEPAGTCGGQNGVDLRRCGDEQCSVAVVRDGSTASGRLGTLADHDSSPAADQTPSNQNGRLGRQDSGFWRSLADRVRGGVWSGLHRDEIDGVVQNSMLQLVKACSTCTTRACDTACPLPELADTVACRRSIDRCRKLESRLERAECTDLDTMPGPDDQEQNGSARVEALSPALGVPIEELMLLWNRQVDEEGSRPS